MTTYRWEINAITKTWAGPEKGRQKGNKTKREMPSVRSTSRDAADLELCSVESWTHEREGAKARQATFRGLACWPRIWRFPGRIFSRFMADNVDER